MSAVARPAIQLTFRLLLHLKVDRVRPKPPFQPILVQTHEYGDETNKGLVCRNMHSEIPKRCLYLRCYSWSTLQRNQTAPEQVAPLLSLEALHCNSPLDQTIRCGSRGGVVAQKRSFESCSLACLNIHFECVKVNRCVDVILHVDILICDTTAMQAFQEHGCHKNGLIQVVAYKYLDYERLNCWNDDLGK